jgi:SAM-dependent methyltransferase
MIKNKKLISGLSGRDYYAEKYRSEFDREVAWLRLTAWMKSNAIAHLLKYANLYPCSILEIGAGTGSVIGKLRKNGIGLDHYAVDFSEEAIAEIRRAEPAIHSAVADATIVPDPFDKGPYDLVFASHVIEHLEDPESFLSAIHSIPLNYFIAEIPLENLPFGRIKAHFRDRSNNRAGHVQFFSRKSFESMIVQSGWRIVRSFDYAPYLDPKAFAFAYGDAKVSRRLLKRFTENIFPRHFGWLCKTVYHAHYAVLCESDS